MNAYAKIEGLLAHGDEVVIHVGPDAVPVDFVRAGPSLWLGDCTTPGCRGLIETESSEFAAAICPACEDRLDLEAMETPRPPKAPRVQPIKKSLPTVIHVAATPHAKLPAPKYQDTRPIYQPRPAPQCRRCQRYMCAGQDGQLHSTCGVCRSEGKAPREQRACRQCQSDITHLDASRQFCMACNKLRTASGKAHKRAKEKTQEQGDQV